MSTSSLDPLIHNPERLRVVAILAALPDGDALSVTRLQDMIRLSAGSLITCLGVLSRAGYVRTGQAGGRAAQASVALTQEGRAALNRYTAVLRQRPEEPAPSVRVSDADREAVAAALGEHFAQGRLTLGELHARLDATLAASTHGELAQATQDLPDLPWRRGRRTR